MPGRMAGLSQEKLQERLFLVEEVVLMAIKTELGFKAFSQ